MTTNEIMSDILDAELYKQDDVVACTLYDVRAIDIQKCMQEWAKIEACRFLMWVLESSWAYGVDSWGKGKKKATTEELYSIYKDSKTAEI